MTGLVPLAFKSPSLGVDPAAIPRLGKTISLRYFGFNTSALHWGGPGVISGIVKIGSTAVKRKVRLYESRTGILLREQWTNDDGSYQFTQLRKDLDYTVASTDSDGTYNDVIAARVKPI